MEKKMEIYSRVLSHSPFPVARLDTYMLINADINEEKSGQKTQTKFDAT